MGNTCQCCASDDGERSPQRPSPSPPIPTSSPPLPIDSLIPSIERVSSPPPIPTSSPPLPIDSLMLSIEKISSPDQIDLLVIVIEDQLQRIKGTPEIASTSSSLLDSVADSTSLAANIVGTISTEAEKLASTDIAKEMGGLALEGLKKVGEAHWVFLGLSVAAYALERCMTVRSNVSECMGLLEKIVYLAKDLKRFKEAMPGETERLRQAVQVIVEGAVMCCDYINKGRISRYWLATTTQAQLEKTNQSIRDIQSSLSFPVNLEVLQNTKEVLRTTTKRLEESPLRLLEFEPVGIKEKVEDVKALLDMEGTEPARAVVLCGFGGVGKSTLAASVIKNLYQDHSHTFADFKFCRVIVDESADETSHIKQLQRDIIYDFGGGKQDLRNPQEGRRRLQDVMENKSCLLFIDNVVDKKHVQHLLPEDLLWFNRSVMSAENLEKSKTKLRILITSREKNLTSKFNITCKEYDVKVFSDEGARSFLRETILQASQQFKGGFDENAVMNEVADACRGVPILLSVFGKHLRDDRNLATYKEAFKALRDGNPDGFAKEENLSKQLFFVYSKLKEEEQEAFLDICKYFYGWDWELLCKILDNATVNTLQSKMLISKSDSGVVIVHDVLRLMGEKEAEQTRISNYDKLVEFIEDDEADLRNIKGISLVANESLISLESRHLDATCKSLRVLMIGDWVELNGPPCNRAFKKLRYLSVGDTIGFPFEDASKLEGLTAFFNRSKDGMNLHKLPTSLKIISHHLQDPSALSFETLPLRKLPTLQSFVVETKKLVKLPEEFGFPASLVDLQLNCCGQLPKEISNLAAPERLILDKCDMESLPQGMGELKQLKHLSMQNCTKLASLPKELALLSSMACLKLSGCTLLQYLPEDLGNLSALEELSMTDCQNLGELPQRIGGLSSLQKLDLTGCISLKTLPESFAELRIESLTLQSLLSLESLPSCFGNMPSLSHLKLISCNSLSTLPDSFVKLKCLQTLKIKHCSNIVALPENFGKLSLLSEMTVRNCPKLQELPNGFQALPALKDFYLVECSSLVSLPSGFGELTCLENLILSGLLISSLPDGFGKLKRLVGLVIRCFKLETLSDDFENLPSLTIINLKNCYKLDGAAMERITKLQHCYYVDIERSAKLIERWKEIREEEESPMVVCTEENIVDWEEWKRAARVGLLCGKCVEWDNTAQQLIERSASMLFEDETTVAVIGLPLHMEFHHHHLLQRLVGAAMEKAKTASKRGRLRIVYVKRVKEKGETTKQEKEEEAECFRQILKLAPVGSCAIASTDLRRHRLITLLFFDLGGYRADNKLACCMANVEVDDKDNKFVEFETRFGEDDISGEAIQTSESSYKGDVISNGIGDFIESICSGKSSVTAWPPNESRLTDFIQILKENSVDHLIDSRLNQVPLDQLKGNVAGIFISDLNTPEYIKLEQMYKDLKSKGHNFEMMWIPLLKNELYGHGTYTRAIQKMSWTVLPNPNMVKVERKNPVCIIFDEEGNIANRDALSAMMSWGAEVFPFTENKVYRIVSTMHTESSLSFLFNEIVSMMHTDSSLSFLFDKLNLVNNKVRENKLIFLYAEPPSPKLKMKFSLQQLEHVHNNVQIIYVGYLFEEKCDFTTLKDVYEDVVEEMPWPRLSFEDMVTFWYRCKFFCEEINDNSDLMIEEPKSLAKRLYIEKGWLVVLDTNGVVTRSGYEMVKMLCKTNDEKGDEVDAIIRNELLESLSMGKCNQIVRKFFKDIIINHPKHSQHDLTIENGQFPSYHCNSCYSNIIVTWDQKRIYRCNQCDWDLCTQCWTLFVKREVQNSHQE